MNKKVLVLYYTQTGQLADIVNSFLQPFKQADVEVDEVRIYPEQDFEFPWSGERFFDAMPESVLATPIPLKPFSIKHSAYDLVFFAYQPWFLSLSIPANSILQHPQVKEVLKGANVVTLIGSRNMWLNSQRRVKEILKQSGANLVGNIALADKNANLVSAVTIMYWMFTGKKDKFLGVFPKPGISEKDIEGTSLFGNTVLITLTENKSIEQLQNQLIAQGAVQVHPNYMIIEDRAPRLFQIWANFISGKKNRKLWLKIFKYYLLFALFIVAPIVLTVNLVFFRPFMGGVIKRKTEQHQSVK